MLLPQLRKEAANGRWEIVSPENFVVSHFGDGASQSIAIGLVYVSKIQEYVWCRLIDVEHFVQIEIFNIEEVFDTLCNQLDEILPQFAKFSFLLPIPPIKTNKGDGFHKREIGR